MEDRQSSSFSPPSMAFFASHPTTELARCEAPRSCSSLPWLGRSGSSNLRRSRSHNTECLLARMTAPSHRRRLLDILSSIKREIS